MREMATLLDMSDPDPLVANPRFGLMGCSSSTSSKIRQNDFRLLLDVV